MRACAIESERWPLPYGRGSVRRRGFTIIELIVSVGLLALMMSLAGKVFSISVASTGQATALIEVSQSFRLLGATLRDDLRSINPERSMLVIDANPINAYWTAEGHDIDQPGAGPGADGIPASGYPHDADPERENPATGNLVNPRADVLMTFTSRNKATSVVYPSIWSNIVQVVYGHAELGELAGDGTWSMDPVAFPADSTTVFDMPASDWHLARRMVLGVDALQSVVAVRADPNDPDQEFPDSPDSQGLVEGTVDIIPQDENDTNVFFFTRDVIDNTTAPFPPPPALPFNSWWYARSRLDLTPPAAWAHRLGHYFLPKCASVKVEWTISGKLGVGGTGSTSVTWHDPADALVSGADPYDELDVINPLLAVELHRRFSDAANPADLDVIGPGTPIWFARDPASPGDADPLWPTALRITVDVYDDAGRLSRPTRHVFILPIGEG